MRILQLERKEFSYRSNAWANSTKNTYKSCIKRCNAFLTSIHRTEYPMSENTIALYLTHLAQEKTPFQTINVHIAAVKSVHVLYSLPFDGSSDRITLLMKGIKRGDTHEKNKKEPITKDIMVEF